MKIEVTSKKGLRTSLSIVIDKKTIQNKLNERLIELQSEVNLKGSVRQASARKGRDGERGLICHVIGGSSRPLSGNRNRCVRRCPFVHCSRPILPKSATQEEDQTINLSKP